MWEKGSRIKILVGHYGSGKTEIALNLALEMKNHFDQVALVDLDIVNPFFRSAEQGDVLKQAGIKLLAPTFALTGLDIPALPAEIQMVFANSEIHTVFDVGGDDAGALALGKYKREFEEAGYELIYVVNPFRPRSDSVQAVVDMMNRVAQSARLVPSGLINNANLGGYTTREQLQQGLDFLKEVSRATGVPLIACSGQEQALDGFDAQGIPKFFIRRYLKPEWMEE